MSIEEILFILVVFIANIIQTTTCFAGTVLAMPLSIRFLGEEQAKAILNLIAVMICLYVIIAHFKDINWKELGLMILFVGAGFGTGFGISIIPHDPSIFLKVYGAIICLIAIVFFFLNTDKVKLPLWLLFLLLFLGGILHQLYVSGGPLVVIYATYRLKDKNQFRATLSIMWLILNSILFGEQMAMGYFTSRTWMLFGIAAGASVLSIVIGQLIAKKLNLKVFLKITYGLLLISGISLIV